MWNDPYLETCCRAALHRLVLSGEQGRPMGLKDGPCLARLAEMGLVKYGQSRAFICDQGLARHATEILRQPAGSVGINA
jgi:hypothetical protein